MLDLRANFKMKHVKTGLECELGCEEEESQEHLPDSRIFYNWKNSSQVWRPVCNGSRKVDENSSNSEGKIFEKKSVTETKLRYEGWKIVQVTHGEPSLILVCSSTNACYICIEYFWIKYIYMRRKLIDQIKCKLIDLNIFDFTDVCKCI